MKRLLQRALKLVGLVTLEQYLALEQRVEHLEFELQLMSGEWEETPEEDTFPGLRKIN